MVVQELELRLNNLYRTGAVETFANGEQMLLREPLAVPGSLQDKYHTLKEGQDLDWVAWFYYKDLAADTSKLWWVIADANEVYNPFDLSDYVGKQLVVPDIQTLGVRF